MSDVFISYANEDRPRAERIAQALEGHGWPVWWDRDIRTGRRYRRVIEEELGKAQCVVVLWSAASVQSDWVHDEAQEGQQRGILVPVLIEKVRPPLGFRQIQAADLTDWAGDAAATAFRRLRSDIEDLIGAPAPPAETPAAQPVPDKMAPRVNPLDGLTHVFIPPGNLGEHKVEGYWLATTPVTQGAWKKVMGGENPSHFKGDQLPVESVDWHQAMAYCKAIGGRLPTEREWEYAARAGTTGDRYGPLDDIAWYKDNSGGTTHPVGLKQPNAFGLYDMLGNVWEWTADDYETTTKVMGGGSWLSPTGRVRASLRSGLEPSGRSFSIGFRCVGEFR